MDQKDEGCGRGVEGVHLGPQCIKPIVQDTTNIIS